MIDNMLRYIIIRLAILTAVICAIVLMAMTEGCGPLSPHINADVAVTAKVSGSINLVMDISQLTEFFTTECTTLLGPSATPTEISTCAASATAAFLNAFAHP